jgi:hypothetical protein
MPAGGERCPFAYGDFGTSRFNGSWRGMYTECQWERKSQKGCLFSGRRTEIHVTDSGGVEVAAGLGWAGEGDWLRRGLSFDIVGYLKKAVA